ncbi:uncharacterized protein TM35_000016440 [Trypanosoma theileri]|uniref:Uncharacterized protein n=1 Tax=Trypanosoma theileri TaxID=67003 RepID=A0A1X0PA03_9TRYP|nr:uncharacterized protein TM35_000016440 [Trypanosoma theileri]ORC93767.1 hypothetical protein TM35_000016440 [Trypanosoma theileri]
MVTKVSECNWFLLFDIALSHGESLRRQELSFGGLMTLLRSAGLLGPNTGVYQVLLETLWQYHGHPSHPTEDFDNNINSTNNIVANKMKNVHELTVNFDGFIEIMNVVCVRCFQTQRYSELVDESRPLSEAVVLSAEDQVKLKESVIFTSRRFFKPLINRSIVLKRMVVSLDSMKNNWTPYTNQLVTHIIASSIDSIVLPLFYRYAENGRVFRPAFEKMIADIFPHFSPVQKKSAVSIFDYREFFGIHNLMKYCRLKLREGVTTALELDSFAEALLMLGIVAFSDEVRYEHHRPLTAKFWSVFEDYYSKFIGVLMVPDPLFDNKYAVIQPAISLVFPLRVPLDKVSSFIIGGWNLTVEEYRRESLNSVNDYPPCILEIPEEKDSINDLDDRRLSGLTPSSSARLASKLFDEELDRPTFSKHDLPLYGMKRCKVYVNQYRATAFQRGPNHVEVVLPRSLWDISIRNTRIDFVESGGEGKLTLSPMTRVVVSLRGINEDVVYSSKDVLLMSTPLVESISVTQLQELKTVFSRYATDGMMQMNQFDKACDDLFLTTLGTKDGGCSLFLQRYLETKQAEGSIQSDDITCKKNCICFSEFVSAVATLVLQQMDTNGYLPSIPYILSVALSRATQKLPSLVEKKRTSCVSLTPQPPPKSSTSLSCPHNARVDVPYTTALQRRASSTRLYDDVETAMREVGKKKCLIPPLPCFPLEARTVSVVSQYNDDMNGLHEKVVKTSEALRESFLKKEMVVSSQGYKTE